MRGHRDTIREAIPETLEGLSIFLEEAKKEQNRIRRLELIALERYKRYSGKDYEYKKRGQLQ